jgi:hypothetical protein
MLFNSATNSSHRAINFLTIESDWISISSPRAKILFKLRKRRNQRRKRSKLITQKLNNREILKKLKKLNSRWKQSLRKKKFSQ